MVRWQSLAVWVSVVAAAAPLLAGPPQRGAAAKGRASRTSAASAACAAELGTGLSSGRRFCDVVIATKPADSIAITIPPRRGAAHLLFDLHNRIAVPPEGAQPAQMFARNTAVVAVVGPKSEVARGVADSEFRRPADLFDRIGGGPGGRPKTVAPGPPTPIDITIPAGVSAIGIVGVRLKVLTRLGDQAYDTPGRPIAIVSNLRVEFTPLR